MVAGLEWYLHTMGYYSAIERNKVLIHATVWMHLENTMPTKRHVSYDLTYMRYLEEANSQRQKVEQRMPGSGEWGNTVNSYRFISAFPGLPWWLRW